jgi:hypothetical protein
MWSTGTRLRFGGGWTVSKPNPLELGFAVSLLPADMTICRICGSLFHVSEDHFVPMCEEEGS